MNKGSKTATAAGQDNWTVFPEPAIKSWNLLPADKVVIKLNTSSARLLHSFSIVTNGFYFLTLFISDSSLGPYHTELFVERMLFLLFASMCFLHREIEFDKINDSVRWKVSLQREVIYSGYIYNILIIYSGL